MTVRSREYDVVWNVVVERFTEKIGRAPTTKIEWNTVEAAVDRVLSARASSHTA